MHASTMVRFCRRIAPVLATLAVSCTSERTPREPGEVLELARARTRGLAFLEENQLPQAEAEFRRIIELAPEEPLGHADLGVVLLRQGRYEDARGEGTLAVELASDDPDIRLILATVEEVSARPVAAREVLERSLAHSPTHVRSLYMLARLLEDDTNPERQRTRAELLGRAARLAPANLPIRLALIESLLQIGRVDSAAAHLEELRRQLPLLSDRARSTLTSALRAMRAGEREAGITSSLALHNLLRITPLYRQGVQGLEGLGAGSAGFPLTRFAHISVAHAGDTGFKLPAIRFTELTQKPGAGAGGKEWGGSEIAPAEITSISAADIDGDGDPDLIFTRAGAGGLHLLRNDGGRRIDVTAAAGLSATPRATDAGVADFDNDGALDIYVVTDEGGFLYRNEGGGRFADVTGVAGVGGDQGGRRAAWADVDHDGDLDLFVVARMPNRLYRNLANGRFTEVAREMGLAGDEGASLDVAIGDFDDDVDLDLLVARQKAGVALYTNLRQGRFADVAAKAGLGASAGENAGSTVVAVGDADEDGSLDLFLAGPGPGQAALRLNRGDGTFAAGTGEGGVGEYLRGLAIHAAVWLDFDNDGHLDLLVGGEDGELGVRLLRGDGRGGFTDASPLLPADLGAGSALAATDWDGDGDQDVVVGTPDGHVRLMRNDGGNANGYLAVRLKGLRTGNGKTNYFGLGSRLDVWSGVQHQTRVVTDPVTHFGLGGARRADVVRVRWTNGVGQNDVDVEGDRTLVEKQVLKGSCPFLYTWTGERYEFFTDMMWRTALGMPLGILGEAPRYAPPDASRETLLIPGERLRTRNGAYSLQITEELWETAYLDRLELTAVDHPDSVDLIVDERFVPTSVPFFDLYAVSGRRPLRAAVDDQGRDQLPLLRAADGRYTSEMEPGPYQGVTRTHDLILDLGRGAPGDSVILFLKGWIFPTDASINVAIAQNPELSMLPPQLEVMDAAGRWRMAIPNLSFPTGKDKWVVADLSGKFPAADHRVRIRTNMEIYWDYAFSARRRPLGKIRRTPLRLLSADLHYRGFSRLYRRGGRYGPHWFDYADVDPQPRWHDLEGEYTRYGDVLPLLGRSDDEYVIFNAGDEISVRFDAASAPPLPPDWKRDFLIFSDAWLKDGDLNTATGKTVVPLPFHGMTRYPYGKEQAYPSDAEHVRYRATYNTRRVTHRAAARPVRETDGGESAGQR